MNMEEKLKIIVCETIDTREEDLNGISQKIWERPELGWEEYFAHDLLTSFLEKEGFKVSKKTPLETSFIAKYGNSDGLKIGILCEYDALPGIGHACGHNLIAEAGIAAALGIKAVIMSQSDLKAEVLVFGTPAEELEGGKINMIKKGNFDETDFCMMSHPSPIEVPVANYTACGGVNIIFSGKASHATAAPWEGINALDAAVACYNSVSMLRQQIKPTSLVHGVITDGGERPNVIPERSELQFSVRDLVDDDMMDLAEKVKNCARGAALSTGCTVEFNDFNEPYFAVKSNKVLIDLYIKNATSLGVVFPDKSYDMVVGSTDMGNVSKLKPSIHPVFAIKAEGPNHTHIFNKASGLAENQLPTLNSAKSMAMAAIDVLCNADLMVQIKEDFEK